MRLPAENEGLAANAREAEGGGKRGNTTIADYSWRFDKIEAQDRVAGGEIRKLWIVKPGLHGLSSR